MGLKILVGLFVVFFTAILNAACIDSLQLIEHRRWLKHHFRNYTLSDISRRLGGEYPFTAQKIPGGSVVSFGPGADIFRPLYDFPTAETFHLVDTLNGWGQSPGDLLLEIKRRLLSIHPTAVLKIIEIGFLQEYPILVREAFYKITKENLSPDINEKVFDREYFFDYWKGWYTQDSKFRAPLVFEVKWESEIFGTQIKKFIIHPIDFNDENQIKPLQKFIADNLLVGILITGISPPNSLQYFIDHLSSDGAFVIEVYSDILKDKQAITELRKSRKYSIRLTELETLIRYDQTKPVTSKTYAVRRRLNLKASKPL